MTLRIVTVRIDGVEYPETNIRLYQEGAAFRTHSRAAIDTLHPELINMLHDRQQDGQVITVEIEADGMIETAEGLRILGFDFSPSDNAIRSFDGRYGKPIKSRKATAI